MEKDKRFFIAETFVSPIKVENNSILLNMDYPTRMCVIDNEKMIAVDVEDKLKYDYVKITAGHVKLKDDFDYENNRVAIMPTISFNKYDETNAMIIIDSLTADGDFINGNNFFNNEDYLKHIKEESVKTKKTKGKTKTKKYFNK